MARFPRDKPNDLSARAEEAAAGAPAKTLTDTLDAAIAEAERDGYISAEEGRRQVDELLKGLRTQVQLGR